MAAPEQDQSFVDRLSRQGEEALGKIAEELISNPVINGAIARAFEAREKAVQAQEAAMGALNLPSAADIERVTRRLRSLSQRLEGIEDAIDRLEERGRGRGAARPPTTGSARIEGRLDEIARDIAALAELLAPGRDPVPRAQERLTVTDGLLDRRVAGLADPDAQLRQLVVGHPAWRRRGLATSLTPSTHAAATPRRAATWRTVAASISTATAPRSAHAAAASSRGS